MDSVVTRRPGSVVARRRLSRRHAFIGVAALAGLGLVSLAAIREFAPRLLDTTPPPIDVCGPISGSVTWDATHTFVIESTCTTGVTVPAGATLTLDGSKGPFSVLTHLQNQPALTVNGGLLQTKNTSASNTVSFDAEFDTPSWPGLLITSDAATPPNRGTANLAYVNIGSAANLSSHPVNGMVINSAASALAGGYGAILSNVSIFNASGNAIQAIDTPVSITGTTNGVINDAGSSAVSVSFSAPAPVGSGLIVTGLHIGRTGNEAIVADLASPQPVTVASNVISTAGLSAIHLINGEAPSVTGNSITCSGHSDAVNCPGTGTRYPAIFLDGGTYDFSKISGNEGSQNGMDAIAVHGMVTSDLTWLNPTDSTVAHPLGYLVDATLTMQGKTLTIPAGGVVKTAGALIIQNNGASKGVLDASAGKAVFTSLDDNSPPGITQACPSSFFFSCPSPLGGSEWGGITLLGGASAPSTAVLDSAIVEHASTAISINNNGAIFPANVFGLVVRNGSVIQNASSDAIAAVDTPVWVDQSTISDAGAHGIEASFLGNPATPAGLKITGAAGSHTFVERTGSEGILGTALAGQTIVIQNTTVDKAGAYGIRLESAGLSGGALTLQGNTVTGSGAGATAYPAVYLNGVSADFTTGVSGNTGSGNGLDAIVFHGAALNSLFWRTALVNPFPTTPLGYLLDAGLTLNGGSFIVHAGDVVKAARGGQITVNGAFVVDGSDAAAGLKVFTSLKDTTYGVPVCPVTVLTDCAAPKAGDWGGLNLMGGAGATLTNGLLRFASTAVAVDRGAPVTLGNASVDSTSSDGITAVATTVSVSGGTFSTIGQHGINAALSAAGPSLVVTNTHFNTSGNEAIFATTLASHMVAITGTVIDRAGSFGIDLQGADQLTLQNNTVTRSGFNAGGPYPAIYLNGVSGDFAGAISGNHGALNGLDALAFHGTDVSNLLWKTAVQGAAVHDLGYLLDGDLTLPTGQSLTVFAGDIVKAENGAIHLNGGTLLANGTTTGTGSASPSPKLFTSLSDNSLGINACPSALLNPCVPPKAGDWGGLILTRDTGGDQARGALSNVIIRYGATGVAISSGATSISGVTSNFGLAVDRSRITQIAGDGVTSQDTPIELSADTISLPGGHGLAIDLLGAPAGAGVVIRNVDVTGAGLTSPFAEGILGTHLTGHPVWISDSRIRNSGLSGIQLMDADHLVLRNNFICGSGSASTAAGCAQGATYPAIYLNGATADFVNDVRNNQGDLNGLDAIAFHGTVLSNLTWIEPSNGPALHPLGYLLDGGLTMNGNMTLTVHTATVKAIGGGIILNGARLDAANATFTSLKDTTAGIAVCPWTVACGSAPQPGDWGGITVTNDENANAGSASLTSSAIRYGATGITIDSGAAAGLSLVNSEVAFTQFDGVVAQDTNLSINGTLAGKGIHDIGRRGVTASFTGATPANSVTLSGTVVNQTGQDGVFANVANVVVGQTVSITGTTVSDAGTYGIQLIGANNPTLTTDVLTNNGTSGSGMVPPTFFPAMYLNGVSNADFGTAIAGNTGALNRTDAIAFHGSTRTALTWQTVAVNPVPGPLGYLLDGGLTIAGDFTVPDKSVVRTVGGAITVSGNLIADGAGTSRTFTSLLEPVAPVACPSPIIKLAGCTPAAGDWGGLIVSGAATLTGATISYDDGLTVNNGSLTYTDGVMHDILGNAIALNNSGSTISNVTFLAIGGKAVLTSGGQPATVSCSKITSGGVSGGSNLTIAQSDLLAFFNTTHSVPDVTATSGTVVAQLNFWGPPDPSAPSATPPASGQTAGAGTVDSTNHLATQRPTLDGSLDPKVSATLVDNPLAANEPLGSPAQPLDPNQVDTSNKPKSLATGLLVLTAVFGRQMDTGTDPTFSFALPVQPIRVHLPGDGWQSDLQTYAAFFRLDSSVGTTSLTSSGVTIQNARACVKADIMTPRTVSFTEDVTATATATFLPGDAPTRVGAHGALLHGEITTNGYAVSDGTTVFAHFLVSAGGPPISVPIRESVPKNAAASFPVTGLLTGISPLTLNPLTHYTYSLVVFSPNDVATGGFSSGTAPFDLFTTGEATTLAFSPLPSPIVAGQPFAATVTAQDAEVPARTVADYDGTVSMNVSSVDAGAALPSETFTTGDIGDNGVHTFASITLTKVEPQNLVALGTGAGSPFGSVPVIVDPGPLDHFTVASVANQTAGVSFVISATAFDAFGNVKTDYPGGATLQGSLAAAPSAAPTGCAGPCPPSYGAFGTWSGGMSPANATLDVAETARSLMVFDSGHIGTSNAFDVGPAAASQLVWSTPATATAGTAANATLTAEDPFSNRATGYTGTVTVTSTDLGILPTVHAYLAGDQGAFTFNLTFTKAGSQTLFGSDGTLPLAGSNPVTVGPAAASSLTVAGYPSIVTAGSANSVTVTALDPFMNVATGYTGTVHFTSPDGQAVLPADSTLASGTMTFSATLKTAGTQTLTATDSVTSSITGSQSAISVNPAGASSLLVGGYPSPVTAGIANSVTVTAKDPYGNVAIAYSGTVHFTSSDGQAALAADSTLTAGSKIFSATLKTAGTQTLSATDTVTSSITGSQSAITVNPAAAASLTVSGYPSPVTAGTSNSFTVTALDPFSNVASGYAGTVHYTSSDGQAVVPVNGTLTLGTGSFSATLKTAGTQTLTATDTVTSSITGSQSTITVNPATASSLLVSGYPSPVAAGAANSFTVMAEDPYGNSATSYAGTVHFTSSDSQAVLPADSTLTAGSKTFGATLKTAGPQTLTATDTATSSITGTQTAISVDPAAASSLTVSTYPSPTVAGASHSVTVTALDPFGNTATGYAGTDHLTSSDAKAVLPSDGVLTGGVGTFAVTLESVGIQSIAATDTVTSSITGSQTGIAVNPAAAANFAVSGYASPVTAGTANSFTVTAFDPFSNVATGYAGTVHFASSDGQAGLPTDSILVAGTGSFTATLKTAGTQSLTATDTVSSSITGSQTAIIVNPLGASTLIVSGYPSPVIAGTANSFSVTAKDLYGNTATSYAGTVHFTSSDGTAVLPVDGALSAGIGSFSATLKTAGTQTLTATDTVTISLTGTSASVTVNPAAATHLSWSLPATATVGSAVTATLTATDTFGNTATGYTGTVSLTSSDGTAVLSPSPYTFTALDAGVHAFSVTFNTAGSQTVTATDSVDALLATSTNVTVS